MPEGIQIRNTALTDIDSLVECIVQAEKGTGGTISYCKLFNISETTFREVLSKILAEDIPDFEFSLQSFKIAELDGKFAGAYGAWVEAAHGMTSGILKMGALRSFLPKENMAYYKDMAGFANEIGFVRQPSTIQFESIYIPEAFRGRNIGSKLVTALHNDLLKQHPGIDAAYVQVIKENPLSLQAHLKYGFQIVEEKTSSNPQTYCIYSGYTRILMKKPLH